MKYGRLLKRLGRFWNRKSGICVYLKIVEPLGTVLKSITAEFRQRRSRNANKINKKFSTSLVQNKVSAVCPYVCLDIYNYGTDSIAVVLRKAGISINKRKRRQQWQHLSLKVLPYKVFMSQISIPCSKTWGNIVFSIILNEYYQCESLYLTLSRLNN